MSIARERRTLIGSQEAFCVTLVSRLVDVRSLSLHPLVQFEDFNLLYAFMNLSKWKTNSFVGRLEKIRNLKISEEMTFRSGVKVSSVKLLL